MEENTKQTILNFNKGMTSVPSDILCGDDEAAEIVGMTFDGGEMRPIQEAVEVELGLDEEMEQYNIFKPLLYVHNVVSQKNYLYHYNTGHNSAIFYKYFDSDGQLCDGEQLDDSSMYGLPNSVTSIGNTLILLCDEATVYYLWKGSSYSILGTKIPEPEVELCLKDEFFIKKEFLLGDTIYNISNTSYYGIKTGETENYNNAIIGGYSKVLKSIHQKKGFAFPFVARVAVELYDGTYTLNSSPIYLFPTIKINNTEARVNGSPNRFSIKIFGQNIYYRLSADFTGWEDIVKNVVLFVSKEHPLFDTAKDAILDYQSISANIPDGWKITGEECKMYQYTSDVTNSEGDKYNVLELMSEAEVLKNIREESLFYKLCELGTKSTNSTWRSTEGLFDSNTIDNIETQERLTDDYYSHSLCVAETAYSYNSRLHLTNVTRSIFDGFKYFMPYNTEDSYHYTIAVYLHTVNGDKIVTKSFDTNQAMGYYFFYPDPRAYMAKIYVGSETTELYKTLTLTEHPGLNGAYYFDAFPSLSVGFAPAPSGDEESVPQASDDLKEVLRNKVLVSEVDNPFTFKASGYVTVGMGTVLGMAANTQALSQGQFGQYPLLVFSSDGIWALNTGSTGTYTSVHPMSREVCNNKNSIIQTDNAIYFSSEKGLMVVAGNIVKCVTEQINGMEFGDETSFGMSENVKDNETFREYLSGCKIAYDYRDSMLHIFINHGNQTSRFHYVYNMKSGVVSKMSDGDKVVSRVVGDYPDMLFQYDNGAVYSLLNRPTQMDDGGNYSGVILTRPIKFGNVLRLKSIREIRHLHSFYEHTINEGTENEADVTGSMTMQIWASNDCKHWAQLSSLRGKPWKMYRLKLSFTNMSACDRYSGSIFITQERRWNKLR